MKSFLWRPNSEFCVVYSFVGEGDARKLKRIRTM